MKDNPNVAFLSPKILFHFNPKIIWYAGAIIQPHSIYFSRHIGLMEQDEKQYNKIQQTDFACGAALCTRKETINSIGFMDEIFFMYVEETDWNLRARKIGLKVVYFPKTSILHKVTKITNRNRWGYRENTFQVYLYTRNKIILALKYFKFREIVLFFLIYECKIFMSEIYISLRLNNYKFIITQIRALILGLFIGVNRRFKRSCKKVMIKEMNYLNNSTKISRSTTKK